MKEEDQKLPNPERKAHKPAAPKFPPPPRKAVRKPAPPKSAPPAREVEVYSNYLQKKEKHERRSRESNTEKVSVPEFEIQNELQKLKEKATKTSTEKPRSNFLFGSSSKLENDIFNVARKANTVEVVFELIKSTYQLDRSIKLDSFEPLKKKLEEIVLIAQRVEKREAMSKIAKIIDSIVSIFRGVSQNNAISKLKEIKHRKEEFIIKKTPVVSDKKEEGRKL